MAAKGAQVTYVRLRSKTTNEWFVHPELRDRMVAEANEKQTNLTDLAVQILCQRFGVPYVENKRRSSPTTDADVDVLNFGMPPELQRVISASYPTHRMDGIRKALCAYYGLGVPVRAPQRRRSRPRTAAA